MRSCEVPTTCSCEVLITEKMAHYTLIRELFVNNFYQRNCFDLKPVPIIQFILQFGFRIVWDSDPSGFGILKHQSLIEGTHLVDFFC